MISLISFTKCYILTVFSIVIILIIHQCYWLGINLKRHLFLSYVLLSKVKQLAKKVIYFGQNYQRAQNNTNSYFKNHKQFNAVRL